MSVGSNLNEMENIEENVVTKGAKPAEPMQKLSTGGIPPNVEDNFIGVKQSPLSYSNSLQLNLESHNPLFNKSSVV